MVYEQPVGDRKAFRAALATGDWSAAMSGLKRRASDDWLGPTIRQSFDDIAIYRAGLPLRRVRIKLVSAVWRIYCAIRDLLRRD